MLSNYRHLRTASGVAILASIIPTILGLIGTMYPGGFGEGFMVGLILEGFFLAVIGAISVGLALLGVFD